VAALPDDTVIPADSGQKWSPILWDNRGGTVTIAGDAAHSMLPSESETLSSEDFDSNDFQIVDKV